MEIVSEFLSRLRTFSVLEQFAQFSFHRVRRSFELDRFHLQHFCRLLESRRRIPFPT